MFESNVNSHKLITNVTLISTKHNLRQIHSTNKIFHIICTLHTHRYSHAPRMLNDFIQIEHKYVWSECGWSDGGGDLIRSETILIRFGKTNIFGQCSFHQWFSIWHTETSIAYTHMYNVHEIDICIQYNSILHTLNWQRKTHNFEFG